MILNTEQKAKSIITTYSTKKKPKNKKKLKMKIKKRKI